ncbi:hypothetical protein OD917_05365 [Flavobacterium sp. SH_e]|uniref:hypothetical protein n=1 Tax=Flavobacterium TaxID=237 RepID=UPI0021E3C088|nr:hypothetical protein [Flavobacterium sp. SH_e]MCV2484340.1 hypothetical protein [Flavobacterium sp. SH_e]
MYINHPDPQIEKKVNFFYDYYLFTVSQMGRNSDFEIDNFQSLTEKIVYQIDHNFELCNAYLLSYLTHPLLQSDNKYFKELNDHETISALFTELRISLRKRDNDAKNIAKIEASKKLKKHLVNLKKYMFKNALYSIISYLACEHDIAEHKEDLKHYTRIIAVELFFQKKSKADIRNLFDKILSRDIEVFPFSNHLKKDNLKDKEELQKFIENKSFREQFEGILNYLKKPAKKNYFIFRIGNIICEEDLLFKFNDLVFCTKNDSKMMSIINSYEKKRESSDINFFDSEFHLFAIVSQNINHEREDVTIAINKAYDYLSHINKTCNTSGFIDKNSYLFTEDFINVGYNISWSGTANRLNKQSTSFLAHNSPFEFLARKRIKSKNHFLSFEDIYIKAKTNNNIDEYWRYLENLIKIPLKEKFANFIENDLVLTEIALTENYIANILSLWNYNEKRTKLTFEEQKSLILKMQKENFQYEEILSITENEFLKDLIEYRASLKEKKIKDYSLRILNEIYAQRNFIQHSNKIHEKTKLKLEATIPILLSCFRSKLLTVMTLNPKLDFKNLFD